MHGYDIALIFFCFGDHGFFPLQVHDFPLDLSLTQTRGKIEERIFLGGKRIVEFPHGVGGVPPVFVDGQKNAVQVPQVKQKVVYRENQIIPVFSNGTDQRDAVESAQRVIGYNDRIPVAGDVLFAHNLDAGVEHLQNVVGKIQIVNIIVLSQKVIDFVLMNHPFDVSENKPGDQFQQFWIFGANQTLDIDLDDLVFAV